MAENGIAFYMFGFFFVYLLINFISHDYVYNKGVVVGFYNKIKKILRRK